MPGVYRRMVALRRTLIYASAVIAVFSLVISYGFLTSLKIRTEHIDVPVPGLPPEADGFTILQISDLHVPRDLSRVRQVTQILSTLRADVLIITGDFRNPMQGSGPAGAAARLIAAAVGDRMPVFAVQGNNDVAQTMKLVSAGTIRVLDNEAVRLPCAIWLVGWNPYPRRHPALSRIVEPLAARTFILASHSPDVILQNGSSKAALVLSGHTHGGQIRFPGIPPLMTLTKVSRKYYAGLHTFDHSLIYVNRGIGFSMIPLRVYAPPEVTVLRLLVADMHETG